MTTITLPDDLGTRLQTAAKETGGTIADLVREAVVRYLTEMEEDCQDIEAARIALEEYERDGKSITLDELVRDLGIRA